MPGRGFTVIEISVVVALVGILGVLGLFWSRELFDTGSLESEQQTLVSMLTRARSYAFSNRTGVHGVCYNEAEHAYLTNEDEYMRVSTRIRVEGLPTCEEGGVVFSPLSATTSPVLITLTQEERSVTIWVNREGYIEW